MNLLQKIHARWAANSALNTALPSTRVFTGRVPVDTALPYCSITLPAATASRTNKANYYDYLTNFVLWAETCASGETILALIEAAFSNWVNEQLDDSRLVSFLHESSSREQLDEPTNTNWRFAIEFSAEIRRDR